MKRIIGIVGSLAICIGTFLPAWEMMPEGYLVFLSFRNEGYLLIVSGVAAFVLTLLKKSRLSWIPGIASLWALSLAYTRMDALDWEAHVQWGWVVLLFGIALVIAASIIKDKPSANYEHSSTLNVSHIM